MFFFVSGFTLFLGQDIRFDNWYKKRLSRIYPSVLAAGIISATFLNSHGSFLYIALFQRYWFVWCILIYYVVLYPIKHYNFNTIKIFAATNALVTFIYFTFYDFSSSGLIFGTNYFRWYMFFIFMLFGAIVGKTCSRDYKWYHLPMFVFSFLLWYVMAYTIGHSWWQILMIIPTLTLCYSLYKIGNSSFIQMVMHTKLLGSAILAIASLCLECYLIQFYVITDNFNDIFPLNIPLIFILIFIAAATVRYFAEFIRQTIDSKPYNWAAFLPSKVFNINR